MNINFSSVDIKNFMSFESAFIDLTGNGFILVSGVNNNTLDNSASNGSGKSSIWESIIWCLTGSTIRGSKDIVNHNGTDGAVVELCFSVDDKSYKIIRSKEHSKLKTNLKLYVNGEDKSGKGIRDTEQILHEYLPYLTASFLGSVIILGQGLPQRFTNNTPSGRKEILETLSNSDYMILDLKSKISKRQQELDSSIRELEDSLLKYKVQLDSEKNINIVNKNKLDNLSDVSTDKTDLENLNELLHLLITNLDTVEENIIDISENINNLSTNISSEESNKFTELTNAKDYYLSNKSTLDNQLAILESKYNTLNNEIKSLENISDVCPTCGQKIPGVIKIDTTDKHNELDSISNDKHIITQKLSSLNDSYNTEVQKITHKYDTLIGNDTSKLNLLKEELNTVNSEKIKCISQIEQTRASIKILTSNIENYNLIKTDLINSINDSNAKIEKLEHDIVYNNNILDDVNKHKDVVNKFSTIISRDFRGYLLKNVIDFINQKSKEYSKIVFGTDKILFTLNGNNLSISYDNKEYESLSGGEKQRLDIIIQFAIRDMLCQYLNFSSNIIVLDEIFDQLDALSCQKVLDLISLKLSDISGIYIITHHSDLEIPTDHEIIIEKDANGISRIK